MDTLKEIGVQRWRMRKAPHDDAAGREDHNSETVEQETELSEPSIEISVEASVSSNPDPVEVNIADSEKKPVQHDWQSLNEMLSTASGCPSCVSVNPILGDGNINARWVFVVDGPTSRELDGQSLLSGRQGQLFDAILQAVGKTREEIYLTSIFKCPPASDSSILAQCGDIVHHQISLIKPEVVLTMGEFAAQSILRANEELTQLRLAKNKYPGGSSQVICTYSLVQMLNEPSLKAKVWKDLKKCITALDKVIG